MTGRSTSSTCSSRSPPASRCRSPRTTSRCAGHAMEARVYAEDAFNGFLPQAGTATFVHWSDLGAQRRGPRQRADRRHVVRPDARQGHRARPDPGGRPQEARRRPRRHRRDRPDHQHRLPARARRERRVPRRRRSTPAGSTATRTASTFPTTTWPRCSPPGWSPRTSRATTARSASATAGARPARRLRSTVELDDRWLVSASEVSGPTGDPQRRPDRPAAGRWSGSRSTGSSSRPSWWSRRTSSRWRTAATPAGSPGRTRSAPAPDRVRRTAPCSRRCRAPCWPSTCREGDAVEEGQRLGVLEAMKMELALRAPFAGTVTDGRRSDR